LAGADAVGPDAVLNIAGTADLARAHPTIIVATSVKLVPRAVFATLGAPGFEAVELNLFEAVVLDGEVLTPAQAGRRAATQR
jgi:translation initiation factor 2B subunit (eIF-2B alpha/beta/delta family)